MTKNYYTSRNYIDHTTFGGLISNSDFNTNTRTDNSKRGSQIASDIISDWKFDEECKKNMENNKNRLHAKRQQIKALIELSVTFDEADAVIDEYTGLSTYSEKISYLSRMFGCEIVDSNKSDDSADYKAILTTIINKKWK